MLVPRRGAATGASQVVFSAHQSPPHRMLIAAERMACRSQNSRAGSG